MRLQESSEGNEVWCITNPCNWQTAGSLRIGLAQSRKTQYKKPGIQPLPSQERSQGSLTGINSILKCSCHLNSQGQANRTFTMHYRGPHPRHSLKVDDAARSLALSRSGSGQCLDGEPPGNLTCTSLSSIAEDEQNICTRLTPKAGLQKLQAAQKCS